MGRIFGLPRGRVWGSVGVIAVGLASVFVGPAAPACACSCALADEATYERLANVVFEGSALSIEDFRSGGEADAARVRIKFEVSSVSKGDLAGTAYVVTYRDGATCGAELLAGHRYRIYASNEGNLLTTNLCAGNRDLGNRDPGSGGPTEAARPPIGKSSASYWPVAAVGGGFGVVAGGLIWYARRRRTTG
jgi:hypothetical protein